MATVQEILNFHLFSIAGSPITVFTVLIAFLVALASLWLARVLEKATVRFLRLKGIQDEGSIGATARLVHYSVLVVGLASAVHTLGINLTALFTAGAVFAIAVGFAMQTIAQNFVAGLILLVERTIKPGDIIEVEGRMVRVTKMRMRATVTRTWDADELIIPNSVLVASTVKNFTLEDRVHRLRCPVGVSYDSDMAAVREVLDTTARALPWRIQDMDPVILMKQFGSSSVDFEVSVYVDDPFTRSVGLSHLCTAVWFGLKEAGITIAYPQVDVHLDKPALEALDKSDR
jgi:small-conductance mechanosensitive channel